MQEVVRRRPPERGHGAIASAPARLHLGFLDLNGSLGRRFGSMGLALDAPCARVRAQAMAPGAVSTIELSAAAEQGCDASDATSIESKALEYAGSLLSAYGIVQGVALRLEDVIPEHTGLGSGTQLALAVGSSIAHLHGLALDARTIAAELDRGARSGIGVAAFEHGGFLVDGGRRSPGEGNRDPAPPPLIARMDFPSQWRVLLVRDGARLGVHGEHERAAFEALEHFSDDEAAYLCRLVMMRLLPGLAEHDIKSFGDAVSEVQRRVGDHFAPAQGGRYASPEVAGVLEWLANNGAAGTGQSSWGPTGFALCRSETEANRLLGALARLTRGQRALSLSVHTARNTPGTIGTTQDPVVGGHIGAPAPTAASVQTGSQDVPRNPV